MNNTLGSLSGDDELSWRRVNRHFTVVFGTDSHFFFTSSIFFLVHSLRFKRLYSRFWFNHGAANWMLSEVIMVVIHGEHLQLEPEFLKLTILNILIKLNVINISENCVIRILEKQSKLFGCPLDTKNSYRLTLENSIEKLKKKMNR